MVTLPSRCVALVSSIIAFRSHFLHREIPQTPFKTILLGTLLSISSCSVYFHGSIKHLPSVVTQSPFVD
jgi:hypothetical protein